MRRVPLAPISTRQSLPVVLLVSPVLTWEPGERSGTVRCSWQQTRCVEVEFEKAKDKIMMGAERRSMG